MSQVAQDNRNQPHGLSDQRVTEELRKMVTFIRQEAMEKAREIKLKAHEEFAIEKARIVRQEIDDIDKAYEKKYKQAAQAQQIARSTVASKARLQVLSARQEMLDELFAAAEKRLHEGSDDKERYEGILKGFILEGFLALREPEVQVRARAVDNEIVGRAIEAAQAEYKEKEGVDIKGVILEDKPLAEGCAGGVVLLGGDGKIDIDNTFEARLRILQDSALPSIRETLFGKNPNRKHFD
jgi:V-type H+-transporting ATPase subunit E